MVGLEGAVEDHCPAPHRLHHEAGVTVTRARHPIHVRRRRILVPRGVDPLCPRQSHRATRRGYRDAVDLPELLVTDAAEWRTWLSRNHSRSQGVRLVLAKKGTTHPTTLSYDDALDEAICFGWIDGQLEKRDGTTFRRRFTPRSARSPWSQRNVAIAERLSASGRMHRSGEVEVRQAKADGRWKSAYAGQASMEVPEDLAKALAANPRAHATFRKLTSANRYSILYRIGNAKKMETRAGRIEQFIEMLARGETVHPQGPRSPQ
jgi:uncharacterized protein YdeI (YjbR/CyaY-like superfamily)